MAQIKRTKRDKITEIKCVYRISIYLKLFKLFFKVLVRQDRRTVLFCKLFLDRGLAGLTHTRIVLLTGYLTLNCAF